MKLKKSQLATRLLWIISLAIYIIYDIFILIERTPNDTISYVAFSAGIKFFFIPFSYALIGGHWFIPKGGRNVKLMIIIWVLVLIGSIPLAILNIEMPPWVIFITFNVGALIGWRCWGQSLAK